MVDFSKKWKFLSIGLMAILATGFVAPQAFADMTSSILSMVTNIQSQVNNTTYGLKAIQNNVNSVKTNTGSYFAASDFNDTKGEVTRQIPQTDGKTVEINISAQCFVGTPDNNQNKSFISVEVSLGSGSNFQQYFFETSSLDRVFSLSTGPIAIYDPGNITIGTHTFNKPTYRVVCIPGQGNSFDSLAVNSWGHALT